MIEEFRRDRFIDSVLEKLDDGMFEKNHKLLAELLSKLSYGHLINTDNINEPTIKGMRELVLFYIIMLKYLECDPKQFNIDIGNFVFELKKEGGIDVR